MKFPVIVDIRKQSTTTKVGYMVDRVPVVLQLVPFVKNVTSMFQTI